MITPPSSTSSAYDADVRARPLRRLGRRVATSLRRGPVQFVLVFLAFVLVSAAMEHVLEGRVTGSPFASFFGSLWFTVVTITTVGYGDIAPSSVPAQIWAMLEMFVGIGLVGIITGNIASTLVERNRKRALGLVPLRHLSGHTVICGWKPGMRAILLGILDANPEVSADDLVLVTSHESIDINQLRSDARLRGLHFVFGSHTSRVVLQMAQVQSAARVIILGEGAPGHRDSADSRTVLAATTVEAINSRVYTCTELSQPHFVRYLRHARVEEVVLGQENARALLVAASLGDGISNILTRFHPEHGGQLRVLAMPPALIGMPYGAGAAQLRDDGLLPIGLLENTGNVYDRKQERLRDAMKQPTYRESVSRLREVAGLTSNHPVLVPDPARTLREHERLLALRPRGLPQSPEEMGRRGEQYPHVRDPRPEHLFICGWKERMADLLARIVAVHEACRRPLEGITVVASMPRGEAEAVESHPALGGVTLVDGVPTDPGVLRDAEVQRSHRVLVLAEPEGQPSAQEVDARNVMIAIAVHNLNRSAYKGVELYNPAFGEHLRIAGVEEPIFSQRHQEVMLVQAALGTGLAATLGEMLNPAWPRLRVVDFPAGRPGTTFAGHAERFQQEGMMLIGVINYTMNQHARKSQYLYEAQVQPRIRSTLEHLNRLKRIESNQPALHPGWDYVPGDHSRAVVLAPPAPQS